MSDGKVGRKASRKKITLSAEWRLPATPYGALRETRKKCENKIDQLTNYLTVFFVFPLNIAFHVLIKESLKQMRAGRSEAERKSLETFIFHNEVMTPTIWLCLSEFFVFLSELQTAAYSGAARTLRCILETAVEACDFQSEIGRPTYETLIKEYDSIAKKPKAKEKLQSLMMRYNAWVSFMERYKIYEQTKRIAPSFKELVNRLNSREVFQEAPQITDAMKRTYETLSDYVHPSSAKIEKRLEGKASLVPRFNSEEFDIVNEMGVKTLDIVQFLYIKSISHFFGYKNAKEFLKDLAQYFGFPSEIAASFLSLPFSKRLSSGISWRTIQKNKKPKKPRKSTKEAKIA